MARVPMGVDPHKLSPTIEVVDDRESDRDRRVLDGLGRVRAMRNHVRSYPERNLGGRGQQRVPAASFSRRLLADGAYVVVVPAKLSARPRLCNSLPCPRREPC